MASWWCDVRMTWKFAVFLQNTDSFTIFTQLVSFLVIILLPKSKKIFEEAFLIFQKWYHLGGWSHDDVRNHDCLLILRQKSALYWQLFAICRDKLLTPKLTRQHDIILEYKKPFLRWSPAPANFESKKKKWNKIKMVYYYLLLRLKCRINKVLKMPKTIFVKTLANLEFFQHKHKVFQV